MQPYHPHPAKLMPPTQSNEQNKLHHPRFPMCISLHLERENLDAKSKLRLADEIASKAKNTQKSNAVITS